MIKRNALFLLIVMSLLAGFNPAHAEGLTIEITKGTEAAMPIAIVPFGHAPGSMPGIDIAAVIQDDLSASGYFKPLPRADMLTRPTEPTRVRFRNWQALGQDYLLIGQITPTAGLYEVRFQLFDVYKSEQIMGYKLTTRGDKLRQAAHKISDLVFEKLTGKPGVFNTHIAYVTSRRIAANKRRYRLMVADADGHNAHEIAASSQPIMSPAWSPDGRRIAYVSFEGRRSAIYVQTLATGKRQRVAHWRGINGAPAFSPDGRKLALTLSKDGSPDIYILDLTSRQLRKITHSYAIDTEATWSPDGRYLVFTSDRGGRPQLYKIPLQGGRAKRLTFRGDYNARARFSPDGRKLLMVHGNRGDYRIAVMELANGAINVLSGGRQDESPSFAPNGSIVLYATRKGDKSYLATVSADGSMHRRLAFSGGDVREPAWGL